MAWHAPEFDPTGWETAAQLHAQRCSIWAHCEAQGCHHSREIAAQLAEREPGLPVSAYTVNHRLRCTNCGAKRASIRVAPHTLPPRTEALRPAPPGPPPRPVSTTHHSRTRRKPKP